MKNAVPRRRRRAALPLAWHVAEYAVLRANAADTCDDRVSENIFDDDDERAEVNVILNRMGRVAE